MKAWVIDGVQDLRKNGNHGPLIMKEMQVPVPSDSQILVRVKTCGICHTEIDEIEGRTPPLSYPMVPGHQVIGTIEKHNGKRKDLHPGDRVGIAWIYSACGTCEFCRSGRENLCPFFKATGRDEHGGYAEFMVANEHFVYPIPTVFTDAEAAPLLCAGAIGYRSLFLCDMKGIERVGLMGFGASAHLVLKLLRYRYPDARAYVFARNPEEREFALKLGCTWAGDTKDKPPDLLDFIIDTTPVWTTVVEALACLKPGGRLVINAIRKEESDKEYLLNIDYSRHLWLEKEIKSVANVTRKDVSEFIRIASEMPFKPEIEEYDFKDANQAIMDMKHRRIRGAKVLRINT